MSNISVNSLDGLKLNQISSRTNVKSTEDFGETLKDVSENSKEPKTEREKAEVNKPEETKEVKKFEPAKKRETVKQKDEPTDEQLAAALEEVVSEIKEFIQEKFNVTSEELESMMSDLGMTDMNLLETSPLTELVKKLEGITNLQDVLTNPNFKDDLKELLNQVEEIKTQVLEGEKVTVDENFLVKEEVEIKLQDNVEDTEMPVVEEDVINDVEVEEPQVQEEEQTVAPEKQETQEVIQNETSTNSDTKQEFKQNESKMEMKDSSDTVNINAVRPEDFAERLTEDLSARVGERQAITIVRQVVEQISMQTKQGMTTMELQLYPAHLGRVTVQLVSKDGNITAQITAETEAAKNALETQLTLLKENLNNQGLKIESVEVTIASHAFEQNMQGEKQHEEQSGSKNRGKRALNILNESIVAENEPQPEIMDIMGNTVSYSA
ncbi:MAG: flagellar hook-length control protein FliK [Lachnospiraceae bacterium]|nr:flagellar hook-length control protein FliK [Lachnospiraceae bacterium]